MASKGVRTGETARTVPFSPRRALTGLAAFAAAGLGLSAVYAVTGLGLPCPLRSLTGWDCPLCGGTRLGGALLELDPAAAFAANPVVLIGLGVLALLGLAWSVELLGGPALRPPARVRALSSWLGGGGWAAVIVGLAVLWTVLRNLL